MTFGGARLRSAYQYVIEIVGNLRLARRHGGLRVERISAEQFWSGKRARQAVSHQRVTRGEIQQSDLFSFGEDQVRDARLKWPDARFSALEDHEPSDRS